MDIPPNQKIKICKSVREYAQKSPLRVVQEILNNNLKPSEVEIREMWLSELRKNHDLFKEGWYSPPPHGTGILIGTDNDGSRLNYKSFRPKEMWPRKDI